MDVKDKELIEELGRLNVEFRKKVDQEIADIKSRGDVHPETKAQIEAMNTRFDAIEAKMQRAMQALRVASADVPAERTPLSTSVEKMLRFGLKGNACFEHMNAEEKTAFNEHRVKALTATTETGGGVFVTEDFQTEVIKKIANLAGVSAAVRHQATSRDVVRWPYVKYTADNIDTSSLTLTYEDEPDTNTDTDPSPFGSVAIPVRRARGSIKIARELLEDAVVDVMGLITGLISDKVNVDQDRQFTAGVGGKRPEGFLTNADIPTVGSGSSGAFLPDPLITLVHTLPAQYAANARFMTSRLSMGLIRKLKDTQNRYLWEPSVQAGVPSTLLGYPIVGNEHMPAAAAGSKSLIFGDFKQLYMAVDRVGMAIQRLDEKYADTDQVGFIFRLRFGGAVIAPWAAVIQTLA